ncbi:MAG: GGDEF domain-containing protein [Magnetococcales bacterium]|nr:GGDEF domain-containing protein [Magnetococcales bacterium]
MSIKRKFFLILTLLLVSGFFTTSLVSYFVAHNSLSDKMASSTLPLTSDNIYSEIQQDLIKTIFISSQMAHDTFLREWIVSGEQDTGAMFRYLKEIHERNDTVTSFFISEATRKYYHSTGILKTIREGDPQDVWFFRVRGMEEDYEINVDTDTANPSSLTIFINYKVFDFNGRFIGVTGVGLQMERVKQLIESYQKRYGRQVYFIDQEGNVKLYGVSLQRLGNIRQHAGIDQLADQILTSKSGGFEYRNSGHTVFLNSRFVSEFKWYLMVEQEDDPAQEMIYNALLMNLLICAGITVIVLIIANLTIGGYQNRLEQMATTDNLTGLSNRHGVEILSDRFLKTSHRRKEDFSIILFDIDRFKRVNDRYGHPVGDQVIRTIAQASQKSVRDSDVVGRWGGEEYLALLPACSHAQAVGLAEKLRQTIEQTTHSTPQGELTVTVSLGVAQQHEGETFESLVNRADQALYRAKGGGRNQVVQST